MDHSHICVRAAISSDVDEIVAALAEVASEIPVCLDGEERQEKIGDIVIECVDSGESWVAVNSNERIIGFILTQPEKDDDKLVLHLRYGGIKHQYRRIGIFHKLITSVVMKRMSIIAEVHCKNQSGMQNILKRLGFQNAGHCREYELFKWVPSCGIVSRGEV